MSDVYFNEESDYSKENTRSDNEYIRSTIFQPFQFESDQKKTCGSESHEKETTDAVVCRYSKNRFLRNFADLLKSLFNKDLQVCNFVKKRLQYKSFPLKFAKFLRTTFFTEHLRWLLLKLNIFMQYWPEHFFKKNTAKVHVTWGI